ncbi:amidohydrolase family protein [Pacificibacter marinus]|uniref:5-methylthioadenosine/S-adenosylhomocysteine deaminase n=1 Tax=Pacificibacter marinus TaxID=658057 RepID=A0A1Y5RF38_9RHOB|nr:amidohydrolase [Pacificibacter marinus]SEK21719.1 Cytosine/adenosine deaminase [Pacificibacter marinus]SLN16057.1 5-methylthioadenosine/S-adenosylhomocysteine deaminase [Pacificibacter marinus]
MSVIANARILTIDGTMTEIERGWIALSGTRITAIGAGEAPTHLGPVEDMNGDLIMPGMVNPHCHMSMTLFRGLGEDVDDRLFRYILPLERALMTADVAEIGARLAALELIRGGVTTVADMYYFEDRIGAVLDQAGLRGVVGQTLANFAAPDHSSFDEGFARLDALADLYHDHLLITASAAPHAPYSTGLDVLARVAAWSADHPNLPIQMHLAETQAELAWAQEAHGCSTVEVTDRAGLLSPSLVAAHVMYPSEADMDLLAERGVHVAYNARSNGKAGRGIAPITALRARGVQVGIATDGPMSGNTLDLFSQLAPATMFQNIAGQSRGSLPCTEIIRMATIEGAATLGMADRIGSLEVGKQADLIRISLKDPRLHPIYDIYSMLTFATMPTDVTATMVAGEWLMQNRETHTVDADKALRDVLQVADQFKARIVEIDQNASKAPI